MKISILTPVYNEEESIEECHQLINNFFKKKNIEYEHIFVDNSSTDRSAEIIKKICLKDINVKLIINNQNYGILPSLFNALNYCHSDYSLVSFAADLQDPIEFIDQAINQIKKDKTLEVIYAIRNNREEGIFIGLVKKTYYSFAKILSNNVLKPNVNIFQLIKNNVRLEILNNESNNPFIPYLIQSTTFKKKGLISSWYKRKFDKPKNNFASLFDEAANSICNYSGIGSKISFFLSFLNFSACILFLIFNLVGYFVHNQNDIISGIPSIIFFNTLMFAALFLITGIISENINHLLQIKIGKKVSIKEKINF